MRSGKAVVLFGLLLLLPMTTGCSLRSMGTHPIGFAGREARREITVYRQWAIDALGGDAACTVSEAYHDGFVAGFVGHVYAGRTGRTKVAPMRLWGQSKNELRRDWSTGFCDGVDAAIEGRYLERAVISGTCTTLGDADVACLADGYPSSDASLEEGGLLPRSIGLLPNDEAPSAIDRDLSESKTIPGLAEESRMVPIPSPPTNPAGASDSATNPFRDDDLLDSDAEFQIETGTTVEVTPLETDFPQAEIEALNTSPTVTEEEEGIESTEESFFDDDLLVPDDAASLRSTIPPPQPARLSPPPAVGLGGGPDRTHFGGMIRASENATARQYVDQITRERLPAGGVGVNRRVSAEFPLPPRKPEGVRSEPVPSARSMEALIERSRTMFRDLDHVQRHSP